MKHLRYLSLVLVFASNAWAEAPVEDVTGSEHQYQEASEYALEDDAHLHGMSTEQRLKKLEQQIENITRLDTTSKIERLHSQLQALQGTLEKQLHDMKVLSDQQKQFYQDLDDRIRTTKKEGGLHASSGNASFSEAKNANTIVARPSSPSSDQEQIVYKNAFELYKTKQYESALEAMDGYLTQYPRGQYSVNAYYWTGDIHYLQGNPEKAKEAFSIVVTQFPNTQKMPDAMYKLATIEIDAGHNVAAKKMLKKIQQQFPGTSAARLAGMRFQELKLSS